MCTTPNAIATIEPRIARLVGDYVDVPGKDGVARSLTTVLKQVNAQAVTSSEGGKRLRALLTLDAYDALKENPKASDDERDAVIDLACAIEVFQTAALVHDDIIDESDLRRGKPSAHRALEQAVNNAVIGRGLGLMLGDILATASIEIVTDASQRFAHATAILHTFLAMQREVEIGQVLDLGVETNSLHAPEELAEASLDVFRWKTASYTTIAPLALAMLAAGRPIERSMADALAIGHPLGLAFQLADDLLDVTGSSSSTGKPVGGDIREGKRTVLLADALMLAGEQERLELIDIFEAPARSDAQVGRVIDLFESTGAIERSRQRIRDLWAQTRDAIADLHLAEEQERLLASSCARFIPRNLR